MEQLTELEEKQLGKVANEIAEQRKNIGYAIYETGLLKAKNKNLLDRTFIAIDELELQELSFQEVFICLSLYLEARANE